MEIIGPALDRSVDRCAGPSSQLRTVVAALYFELLQRVRRRPHRIGRAVQEILHVGVVVHAVQNEVVLRDAATIRGEIPRARHLPEALVRRRNARRQLRDKYIVAPVQRRVVDRLRLEDLAGGCIFGLQRRRCRHCHHLAGRARLQRHIHTHPLAYIHAQVRPCLRCESIRADLQGVIAHLDRREGIEAASARRARQRQAGAVVGQCHGRVGNHCTARIRHRSGYRSLVHLRRQRKRQHQSAAEYESDTTSNSQPGHRNLPEGHCMNCGSGRTWLRKRFLNLRLAGS